MATRYVYLVTRVYWVWSDERFVADREEVVCAYFDEALAESRRRFLDADTADSMGSLVEFAGGLAQATRRSEKEMLAFLARHGAPIPALLETPATEGPQGEVLRDWRSMSWWRAVEDFFVWEKHPAQHEFRDLFDRVDFFRIERLEMEGEHS